MKHLSVLSTTVVLLAGCAAVPAPQQPSAPPRPQAPSLGFFSRIKVPTGHEPALQLSARGVQIFRCERQDNSLQWRFRLPEAELFDAQGQPVGRHGANFSFEHRDGSRVLGSVVAFDKSDSPDTLPGLLLSAKSFGKGEFAGVTYVQRVNTRGGMPPPACDVNQLNRLLRVDFSADFVFYRPQG
jgi:hypothetical protein